MLQVRLLINTIRHSWWIIILSTIAALNIALFLSYREDPVYRAEVRFIISPNPALDRTTDFIDGVDTLEKIVATYAEILSSPRMRDLAISQLSDPPDDIDDYEITAVVLPESSILELSAQGTDASTTALLANTIGLEAIKYVRGLYQVYEINILDTASVPEDPISPNPVRDSGLAAVLGFVFGSAIAVVREQIIVALSD